MEGFAVKRSLPAPHDRVTPVNEQRYIIDSPCFRLSMKEDALQRNSSNIDWQAIVQDAPLGMYVMDRVGGYTFVNRAWCAIFGIADHEALGERWMQWIHPDDRAQVLADIRHTLEQQSEIEHEYRIVRPDGTVRWVIDRFAVRLAADGSVADCVGLTNDITEQRRGEEENQFLIQIGALLIDSPSFESASRQLAMAIMPRMGTAVALIEHTETRLKLVTLAGLVPDMEAQLSACVAAALNEPPTDEVLAEALTRRRVCLLAEPAPGYGEAATSIWPLLIVPLVFKEYHLGAIILAGLPETYDRAHQLFAEIIAQQVAVVLINWRYYDRERRSS
jgi:PAS domain S-box-containing protein